MAERKDVFTVCPRGEGKKDFWLQIGSCWTNRDGSFTVTLDALPVNGKLIIREPRPRDDQPEPRQQQRSQAPRSAPRQTDFGGQDDSDIPF
ncbi:MAG TPA: hypothetical protein VFN70_18350 [Burkholderiales bacterium]|nr:hypothetical protein [Burkholderiales bacterium]